MIELAEHIFTAGGVNALALIVTLVTMLIMAYTLYSLVKMKRSDGHTLETQAVVIANLIKQQAEITANQLKLADILSQHDTRATAIGTALDHAVATMHDKAGERDRQLNELPGRVSDTMTPKLEELPRAIEETLTPKIEAMKADIEQLIQALDAKLSERIEAATDAIPARITEAFRQELETLKQTIATSFRDLLETAKSVQLPDEDSEPKTEEPEPGEQPASAEPKEKVNGAQ